MFRSARIRRGLVASAAAGAVLLLSAGTAHADLSDGELRQITDQYLFETSLDDFVDLRSEQPHADQLDWSSDSCSYSPDEPLGFDFSTSCDRHDFGYRNYKAQGRFTDDGRLRVDDNFKADMYSVCADDGLCKAAANVYYAAVRQFGGAGTSTADAVEQAEITPVQADSGRVIGFEAKTRSGERVLFQA
ncbi:MULTISPECIES: phospholipase [unclassified Saccharopolyspora]|uniref:phospholipase n=1 Tax=unclassified Saccharopolyspora TaxID=2646250 RepID=UPI001CD6D116|nr:MULTISPECIES: phospholipase [unclassified Saccharopolyspora]MCA1186914.1 phospholipase [Saccharopolyspora sp. 6T]MCA1193323.1 phospholipase [Saccharopolyspora sp. 6V]MCA1281398.1 phospholipase [Saccharopolyspora sp. 7B]